MNTATSGGVWKLPVRPDRPNPYGCQWRETVWDPTANGGLGAEVRRSRSEFFKTAELRDSRMAQVRKEKRTGTLHTATRQEIEEYRAIKAAIGTTPWQDVVAGWRASMIRDGVIDCAVTVQQAVDRELARAAKLVAAAKMSPDSFRQKRQKLTLFAGFFGTMPLNRVSAHEVEGWLDTQEQIVSGAAFNRYLKQIRASFRPYVESGVLARDPTVTVRLRDESTDEIGILTVQQTAHLFDYALRHERFRPAIGRLALEAFLGLRFSSACRIERQDINFDGHGIYLPRKKLKTGMVSGGKGHYIDGTIPKQVWRWLAVTPAACWSLTARQYMELKSALFAAAGVPHPQNCLRHSFCTYDVAVHKNAARTAYLLCHRNQQMLFTRYRGHQAGGRFITERDGRLYQIITPRTAARLARGYVATAAPSPRAA